MDSRFVGLCFLALSQVLSPKCASARSWSVSLDGSGDFTRVTDALFEASDGDSILIEPGNYDESNGTDHWILVTEKSLALLGLGALAEDTALRISIRFEGCQDVVCDNLLFHHEDAPLVSWEGDLTIRSCRFEDNAGGGYQVYGGAIMHAYGNLTVLDSFFLRNRAMVEHSEYDQGSGGAIYTLGPTSVQRCTFVDNEASGQGGAIKGSANVEIKDCIFFRNRARNGAGIFLYGDPSVHRCTFLLNEVVEGNGACVEADADWLQSNMFTNCIIAKTVNGWGVECNYAKNLVCTNFWMNERGNILGFWCTEETEDGNFTADPLFCDETTGDVGLLEESPCLSENAPEGCGQIGARGLGCGEVPTRRVSIGGAKALFKR